MTKLIKFQAFEANVLNWARQRGIFDKATPLSQFRKTREEVGELEAALADYTQAVGEGVADLEPYLADIRDAIGDIIVTLVIQAHMHGMTIEECCSAAWDEIKDRKGRMVDGVFVKEE